MIHIPKNKLKINTNEWNVRKSHQLEVKNLLKNENEKPKILLVIPKKD